MFKPFRELLIMNKLMPINQSDYYKLVREFVELQDELILEFESITEISPPTNLLEVLKLEGVFQQHHSISDILGNWPTNLPLLALLVWVKPSQGVVQIRERNWVFRLHGTLEILFTRIPKRIDDKTLDALKNGEINLMINFVKLPDFGPSVEAFFSSKEKRSFSSRTLHTYTQSIASWKDKLKLSDHESLLKKLVDEEFLFRSSEPVQGEILFFMK